MLFTKANKRIQLPARFVPNTFEHLKLWNKLDKQEQVFTSSIDDEVIRKIMLLDVDRKWKLLLMMGIGVFIENSCKDYTQLCLIWINTKVVLNNSFIRLYYEQIISLVMDT